MITFNTDGYIVINIDTNELNLDKTLKCGQAFRWYKDTDDNWIGVVNNKIWILKQYDNYISTNLTKDDTKQLIYYFDLDTNYTEEISKLDLDDFARKSYEYSKGIHILRQDLIETMVTFLMSSCNTMNNISNIIDKLCKTYGNEISINWNNKKYINHTFPTLEVLSKITEDEFRQLNMGFRAVYLVDMCKLLNDNTNMLNIINNLNYKDALKELTKINGIGNKVANCISLFALHNTEAFPIDTHIKQIINKEYKGILDISNYGSFAGIIQQYMFYYKAFNKK